MVGKILGGNYTKNGHITVEFPPSFALTPMREAWSWDNHLVNLTCRAESIPNATISWFLNGRNLENDYNILTNAFNGESTITVLYFDLIIIIKKSDNKISCCCLQMGVCV